jgi:hypothetical protein
MVLVWLLDLKFLCEFAATMEELQIRHTSANVAVGTGDA